MRKVRSFGSSSSFREGSFNVNGLRSTTNNFLMDGLDNNYFGTSNQGFSNEVVQPPPDAIAETLGQVARRCLVVHGLLKPEHVGH